MHTTKLKHLTETEFLALRSAHGLSPFDEARRAYFKGRIDWPGRSAGQFAAVRRARGLSQKDVAKLFGLSTATVQRWESAAQPPRAACVIAALLENMGTELFACMERTNASEWPGTPVCPAPESDPEGGAVPTDAPLTPLRIERLCRKHCLTRQALADVLNVSRDAVDKWLEAATRPSGPTELLLRGIELYGGEFLKTLRSIPRSMPAGR